MASAFLLHLGAAVMCMHAGTATPVTTNPRVKVSGQPVVVQSSTYMIAGCAQASVPAPFCATATWVQVATRVRAGGVPVVLQNSQAVCAAPGTGLQIVTTQTRVKGD
jgi:hypothetical protein